jgi:hypothetical protein
MENRIIIIKNPTPSSNQQENKKLATDKSNFNKKRTHEKIQSNSNGLEIHPVDQLQFSDF